MDDRVEYCWENGWQGHEDAQLRRMARWSLRDKIRWLEEAARLAKHLHKQAAPPVPGGPIPSHSEHGH
jgi:hypothetical protein